MADTIENEQIQNSRIFYENYLPGAVTRLRNQSLALVVGVADKEDSLIGLDRNQLTDAVKKYLSDWQSNGGSIDALLEEAAQKNDFRVQTPGEIFVTPFPLILRCAKCGALENHNTQRRSLDLTVASTYNRTSGNGSYLRINCARSGCGGRMLQVPYVIVHRCGHISPMTIPSSARSSSVLGLRNNSGMYRQNIFFDLLTDKDISFASTELCSTCSVGSSKLIPPLQKGTPVGSGDAFYPQVLQFVALSKIPGELVSNIQAEISGLQYDALLEGRVKDMAEGVALGLLQLIDSSALQNQLIQIFEGSEVTLDELANVQAERLKLEKEITNLEMLINQGVDLTSALEASKEKISKLIIQSGAADGTFSSVRQKIQSDDLLLALLKQRRTMESVLLRHDVGGQSINQLIENTIDPLVCSSRNKDWQQVQDLFGVFDITHIPDLKVVLSAIGFTREKREPDRTPEEVSVKLNPFEDTVRTSSKGKAVLYAHSAKTEAIWIKLDPIKVLKWCVVSANWAPPPFEVLTNSSAAKAYLLGNCHLLSQQPGQALEFTKQNGLNSATPFHLLHSICHSLMLTARRHSGYDSQSLTEYLFPMDLSFLIYVTSVQNYTAGGLLTLFQHYLKNWFDDASMHAYNCAFDPICNDLGSSCPGCIQISRGCETFNFGISRSYMHGGFADKDQSLMIVKGFWQ